MLCFHMTISIGAAAENLHANPTDMRTALFALHVVAAFGFLDSTSALRAVPRIVLLLPCLEGLVAKYGLFVLVAR